MLDRFEAEAEVKFPSVSANLPERDLIFDFFSKFSIFECALKRTNYLSSYPDGGAKVDWKKFVKKFGREPGLKLAAKRLIDLAPQKQIVAPSNQLGWDVVERKTESDTEYALRLLQTVRNNLFHGGKYPYDSGYDPPRNKAVLQAALALLEECYKADLSIRTQINSSVSELTA